MSEDIGGFAVNVKRSDGEVIPWSLEELRKEVATKKEEYLVGRFGHEIPQMSDELWTLAKERLDSVPIQDSNIGLSGDREQRIERNMTINDVRYRMILLRHYGGRYETPSTGGEQVFVPSNDGRYSSEIRLRWELPPMSEDEEDAWYEENYRSKGADSVMPELWKFPWGERDVAVWLETVEDNVPIYTSPRVNINPAEEQPRVDALYRSRIGYEEVPILQQLINDEDIVNPAIGILTWGSEDMPLQVFPSTGEEAFIGYSRNLREDDVPYVEIMLAMLDGDDSNVGQ